MSYIFILLISAALYAMTMKVADLLNEHGLKWFSGSNILFGVLWGVFGAILVLFDVYIANIVLAMNIAFIVRMRLDYINHSIASSIIIIVFLWKSQLVFSLFFIFYLIFVTFGGIKDIIGDKRKKKDSIYLLSESMLYYSVPTLVYSLITGHWNTFFTLTVFTLFYNFIKYLGENYLNEKVLK